MSHGPASGAHLPFAAAFPRRLSPILSHRIASSFEAPFVLIAVAPLRVVLVWVSWGDGHREVVSRESKGLVMHGARSGREVRTSGVRVGGACSGGVGGGSDGGVASRYASTRSSWSGGRLARRRSGGEAAAPSPLRNRRWSVWSVCGGRRTRARQAGFAAGSVVRCGCAGPVGAGRPGGASGGLDGVGGVWA